MADTEVSRYCDECGSTRARSEKWPLTCLRCTGEDQVPDPADLRSRLVRMVGAYDQKDVALPPGQGGTEAEAWHERRAREARAWR